MIWTNENFVEFSNQKYFQVTVRLASPPSPLQYQESASPVLSIPKPWWTQLLQERSIRHWQRSIRHREAAAWSLPWAQELVLVPVGHTTRSIAPLTKQKNLHPSQYHQSWEISKLTVSWYWIINPNVQTWDKKSCEETSKIDKKNHGFDPRRTLKVTEIGTCYVFCVFQRQGIM